MTIIRTSSTDTAPRAWITPLDDAGQPIGDSKLIPLTSYGLDLTEAFEVVTEAFEVVTEAFEVVTEAFEVVTEAFEVFKAGITTLAMTLAGCADAFLALFGYVSPYLAVAWAVAHDIPESDIRRVGNGTIVLWNGRRIPYDVDTILAWAGEVRS